MNSTERAEAAYKRLLNHYGARALSEKCINPDTGKPISRQAVERWSVIPLVYVKALSRLDGCEVRDLRPDVWDLLK